MSSKKHFWSSGNNKSSTARSHNFTRMSIIRELHVYLACARFSVHRAILQFWKPHHFWVIKVSLCPMHPLHPSVWIWSIFWDFRHQDFWKTGCPSTAKFGPVLPHGLKIRGIVVVQPNRAYIGRIMGRACQDGHFPGPRFISAQFSPGWTFLDT